MKRKPAGKHASEHQRARRIAGWDRIRAEKGIPAPTEEQREARRIVNQRYFANLKKKQRQQQKAA